MDLKWPQKAGLHPHFGASKREPEPLRGELVSAFMFLEVHSGREDFSVIYRFNKMPV